MNRTASNLLMDREAICDCLYRICYGIDRRNEAALRSSYWPDAKHTFGAYSCSVEHYIQLVLRDSKIGHRTIHQTTNVLVEFTGPAEAIVESYLSVLQSGSGKIGPFLFGQQIDLFQKRNGEWRIGDRRVICDGRDEHLWPLD
ncbi:nuclear transport factor 2 family protein [Sinorhizobium meliloti]|uniref:nuclear transport factor 2 family protein n=2 Tax=Rhizobium meliloti TaxID=382 RepID=UPI0001E4AC9D|nr:nuclear transport factor 2 family protein [Sinorhizobium meliloti]AEG57287.1 gamma-BHC dehydrochlorinase [Sinorhizobium meliloti AK83]SEJ85608.1 SnoaL-like domain-containing protein [Sinorhizobium meliloti]